MTPADVVGAYTPPGADVVALINMHPSLSSAEGRTQLVRSASCLLRRVRLLRSCVLIATANLFCMCAAGCGYVYSWGWGRGSPADKRGE